ncbi:MAG: DUF1330 domain-containing protein [Pseudomonadota bacterium]
MVSDRPILAITIISGFDPDGLAPVFEAMPAAVQPYLDDFTLLNSDGSFDVIEGDAPQAVVVTRWPSRALFDEYWNSTAAQHVKALLGSDGSLTLLVVPDLNTH